MKFIQMRSPTYIIRNKKIQIPIEVARFPFELVIPEPSIFLNHKKITPIRKTAVSKITVSLQIFIRKLPLRDNF